MRLIDADALKNHIKIFSIGCGCYEDYQKSFLSAIDEQPTIEPEQRWIPVSERPPEEDEQVFVYLFDDSPYIAWVCDGRWHTEEFTLDEDEEPAAWMLLPEQWRGEEHEVD